MSAEPRSKGEPNACARPETLLAYVDGALDATAVTAIEAHLAACPACSTALEEAQQLRLVSKTLFEARLNQRDLERIDRWTRQTLDAVRDEDDEPPGSPASSAE